MSQRPLVSFVMATFNRREVVLRSVQQVRACGLDAGAYEIIAVDNCSVDGTADALARERGVRVLRLRENLGSCAKALGVQEARGEFLFLLDDDSYPRPGCGERMLAAFGRHADLAAAGCTIHLPDGRQECSALPHVFVGCGVGLRTEAVRGVGGLDRSFFMQAEEYDLSFRLLQAGWRVEVFSDLQVEHGKSPLARRSERTTFFDIRNNLRVVARHLPRAHAEIYGADWIQRYRWLAEEAGHQAPFARGVEEGQRVARLERDAFKERRLPPAALEEVFSWQFVEQRMLALAEQGVRRLVLVDLGKNVYAFLRGAAAARLDVLAITDDRLADPHRSYRGCPVVTLADALAQRPDALVVSNTSYVHAAVRTAALRDATDLPVHAWFAPPEDSAAMPAPPLSDGALAAPAPDRLLRV